MGELWVLLEFDNTKAKELFRDNVGVGSWFSVLRQASHDFTPEGRIAWVDVEGIPFKFWSGKTFKKIATKWGELLDCIGFRGYRSYRMDTEFFEDEEDDDLSERGIHQAVTEVNDENPSLKYPLGFTPSVEKNGSKSKDDQVQNISDNQLNGDNESVHQVEHEDNRNSDGAKTNSIGSRKFKMSEIPRTGGSILSVMEEIMKILGKDALGDVSKCYEYLCGKTLSCMVSKKRVKRAVWDCGTDKSPGPDGFTFGFYRHFWSTIENDVFEAINVLGDIVNEVQSAFISERQILDGPFILNEIMQWCRRRKKQSLIFKVDFEKAYDSKDAMYEDDKSTNLVVVDLHMCVLEVDEDGKIFKLARMDHQGLEYGRYGVSKVLDTAYRGFLGVGTTFDIFQNILFPYGLNTAYWSFLDTAYWILFPSWSLVSAGTDTPYLP
ncbi:hypothetical protein Tco_0823453 [Tanacetum coccineum]|uniref:RNA-directed DNA polymerase, eukaryota, reverse transcriptase zinc-binding domain protein n=1 Tax=Tanacetum coccineum TaxID=301880 RepID=A0ABQ5AJQ8_9ASTR